MTGATLIGQTGTRYRLWAAGCGIRLWRAEGPPYAMYAQRDGEQKLCRVGAADVRIERGEIVEVRTLGLLGGAVPDQEQQEAPCPS